MAATQERRHDRGPFCQKGRGKTADKSDEFIRRLPSGNSQAVRSRPTLRRKQSTTRGGIKKWFLDAHLTPRIGDPSQKKATKTTKCAEKCTVVPLRTGGRQVAKSGPARQPKPLKLRLNGHIARRRCEEAEFYIWDTELPGFGLRFRPSGGKRWLLRYVERGRARVWTIGNVIDICAEDAREAARRRLRDVALLGLPKKPMPMDAAVKVSTFADLVEHFLADRPFAWKPSTESSNRRCIKIVLLPYFGSMAVDAIRKQDVLRWRDSRADRSGAFNREIAVLSGVMQYAEQLSLRKRGSNPARGTPRFNREEMQRFLEPAEYRRLHLRLSKNDNFMMVAAIRLLLHTGARCGEISNLRWGEVSRERLELADSKTGPKSILLSRQAKAILDSLPCGGDDELVFSGRKGQPANLSAWWAIFRRTAGLPDVRLHDLRHSYASIAIQNGISLEPIGRLLGHALTETTERYAHLTDQCIIEAAEVVGASVFELMGWSHETV